MLCRWRDGELHKADIIDLSTSFWLLFVLCCRARALIQYLIVFREHVNWGNDVLRALPGRTLVFSCAMHAVW